MNILEKLQQVQAFCKAFKNRKAYLDNLKTYQIANQAVEVAKLETSLKFAQENLDNAKAKLDKYKTDLAYLAKWIPENQDKYDQQEVANNEKLNALAVKIEKAMDEIEHGSGEGQIVL